MDLKTRNAGRARLREMLAGTEPVLAPGAYDGLSARLIEQAGFEAVYMTGFRTAASLLGRPDIGLLSFGEMVEKVRAAVEARSSEDFIGLPEIRELEERFAHKKAKEARTSRPSWSVT